VARKRPTASHVRQPALTDGPVLARDEADALRRSAPLVHAKLTELFTENVHVLTPAGDAQDNLCPSRRRWQTT
jgi:hypothetical protein